MTTTQNCLLGALLYFVTLMPLSAQSENTEANPIIKKDLLIKDLTLLRTNLGAAQPGLYNYTSKEEFDAFFESIAATITNDMSSLDFFKLIAPLSNKIRNGHTILVPSSSWEDHVVTQKALLPLNLYYHENTLYVLHNLSDTKNLQEGAILRSINGQPAIEVFNHLVESWFKDGYNRTRPAEIVEEEFRFLYSHFYETTPIYSIEINTVDGKSQKFDLKGIIEPEFKKRLLQRYNKKYTPWWRRAPKPLSLKINESTAYLAVTLFSNGAKSEDGQRFSKFVKNAFKTIKSKKVTDLIIDLRGNQGGDVKPQLELLKHLINKPFHLYKEVYANVRKLPNPELYEFNLLNRNEFKKNFSNESMNGVYAMKPQLGFEPTPQEPSPNVFEGNLYVLIDGWSFSATGEVSGLIKEHRNDALFIGEETGGNPVTNISGIQTFMTLPHSKNRILICLVNYTTDVSYANDGQGVRPHHTVRNTVFEELKGDDAVLARVKKLIAEAKK